MKSDHSTKPDVLTGWQPRQLTPKLKQFPLFFINPPVDLLTKSLTTFGTTLTYRVVYMGPRHSSNMKVFKNYCKKQQFRFFQYPKLYGLAQLQRFSFNHSHEQEKFFPIRTSEYRLFTGMNPTLKKDDLIFDSNFQCGNLDLAIYVNPVEYDLLMRVDSNTKGHTAWFFFKVTPSTQINQKIKFNIINFGKKQLLYKEGMKPYVFKTSLGKWTQQGISVSYEKKRFRYEGSQHLFSQSLSFIYEFKNYEAVFFAYCIPYSYSYLLHRLKSFEKKSPNLLKISYKNESTGGLPIPLLTITDFTSTQNNSEKETILCTGRMHPGETQGSWMMDGFIQFLLSSEGKYLREKKIFKIIPMLNVDGVILGNFRTGIMGRDLNRSFYHVDPFLQIKLVKEKAIDLKPDIFLDFHGHSAKRNVFIYGPNYKIQDKYYLSSRVFPKLISKNTPAFRYYACQFKIGKTKRATGRAVMLNQYNVTYSYTIEASSFCYGFGQSEVKFIHDEYVKVGQKIGVALGAFVKFLKILPKRQQLKLEKMEKDSQTKEKNEKKQKYKRDLDSLKSSAKIICIPQEISEMEKDLLNEIIDDEKKIQEEEKNDQHQEQSDCQDEAEDYSMKDIKNMMVNKFDSYLASKAYFQKMKSEETEEIKQEQVKQVKEVQEVEEKPKEEKPRNMRNFIAENKKYKIKEDQREEETKFTVNINERKKTSFETKKSQILRNNPDYMSSIIKKTKQDKLSRIQSQTKDVFATFESEDRNNHVFYDWNKRRKRQSYKHFDFQSPQPESKEQKLKQKRKIQSLQRKKKSPILSIKKSLLPMLGRQKETQEESQDKSMLSEILEEHERKKKNHRNVRIMFL